jgi:hypothetical protein
MSNTVVTPFAFRTLLPIAMLAMLLWTLNVAEQEAQEWAARKPPASRAATAAPGAETVEFTPFIPQFQHSRWIQDVLAFQWPAFAVAGLVAPVPRICYFSKREVVSLTTSSYLALGLAVGGYWLVVGPWLDRRLTLHRQPQHSKVVRILLRIMAVPTILFLLMFLAKDLALGWPEGSYGAGGLTAWLMLAAVILLTELGLFHRSRSRPSVPA